MREVKREWREQDGQSFEVFSTDIYNHNILEAAAGSTGDFPGADKWDVKTYLRIKDQGGTNMKINADHVRGLIEIELQGAAELETMIEALTFMRQALLDAKENNNG